MCKNIEYKEYVDSINIDEIAFDDIKRIIKDAFIDIYGTDFISKIIADENGDITLPTVVTNSDGHSYNALADINIINNEIYEIRLLIANLGIISIEDYKEYLGVWGDEFEPYTYEYTVNYIEE